MTRSLLIIILALLINVKPALINAKTLATHKDGLFAYPKTLSTTMGGRYETIEYSKQRDIIERDAIPLRKAKRQYVDESARWSRRVRSYISSGKSFKYFEAGRKSGASVTVIFIHGKNGNRFLGVNDWTFGGNFNRLQHLMIKSGGVLLTPEFTNFKASGAKDIIALMQKYHAKSKGTKMIVACGSMGAGVCWHLSENPNAAALMDGMFILGGHWNYDYFNSAAFKNANLPILFAHGSKDQVYPAAKQVKFFQQLMRKSPRYPARFVMFETGAHGTPIRMIDWRKELNWILSK